MLTRCYIMTEDHLERIDRKLLAVQHTVEEMRKSDRRDDLIKRIASIRSDLNADFDFGGQAG